MSKLLKQMLATEYTDAIKDRDSLLFINYATIPANQTRQLRDRLRAKGIKMLVVKNRVFDKALEEHGIQGFREIAQGQLAVLYADEEGAAQLAAKEIAEWNREMKTGEIRGGMMEGEIASPDEAKTWKDLPSREEMLSILVGQILGFGSKLAGQISAPASNVASQVKERGEGKGTPPAADG